MHRDRRRRAGAHLGRRTTSRIPVFATVFWREQGFSVRRRALLVGVSGTGMAMLVDRCLAPPVGTRLLPARISKRHLWRRPAIVCRIERLSGALDLVAAEYSARKTRAPVPIIARDRRTQPRQTPDRRRSARWTTDEPICWKVHRGRRERPGRIVQRSREGLILTTPSHNEVPAGTRFAPFTLNDVSRLGFHSAGVRRAQHIDDATCMLCAEIED